MVKLADKPVKKLNRFGGACVRLNRTKAVSVVDLDVDEVFGIPKTPVAVKATIPPKKGKKLKKGEKPKRDYSVEVPGSIEVSGQAHVRQAAVVQAMVDQAFNENGSPFLLVGDQTNALHIGIPMYADPMGKVSGNLALEYLLGMDVFPLGLFIVIIGPSASGKSTLGYEFQRYFYLAGGTYRLIDAESKFSPELVTQILREARKYWQYTQVSNVESWQTALIRQWDNYEQMATGKLKTASKSLKGVGYSMPHMDLVDTISGKSSAEQQEDIEEQGAAGRGHPIHALSIAGFLRAQSHRIQFAPLSTVFVNQEKKGTDTQGRPTSNVAGGQSVKFQESMEIQMTKVADIPEGGAFEGYVVKMSMRKNSMMTEREIHSRILTSTVDLGNGDYEDRTWFDWDWALVKLLVEAKGRIKARMKAAGIEVESISKTDVQNAAYCPAVGIDEDNAVTWSRLGRMLHANEEIKAKLRKCLGISKRNVLDGDFRKQQTKLLKEAGTKFTAEHLAKRAVIKPVTSKAKARKKFAKEKAAKEAKRKKEQDE